MPTTGNRSATIASAASIKAVPIPRRRYAGSTLKSEISGMPSKYDDSHRTVTYPEKTSSTVATSTSRVPASCSARYRWYWLSDLSHPIAANAAAITTGSPPFNGRIANLSPMRPPEVPGSLVRRAEQVARITRATCGSRHLVARIAVSMTLVTGRGSGIRPRWPGWMRVMVEWARVAMKFWAVGVMIRSLVPRTYQDRIVAHAGGPDRPLPALKVSGRCDG